MRILVAEDEPVHRRILATTLARWGYEVCTASDGEQAWAMLQQDAPPSLVVTDWDMPGLDGLALIQRIRGDSALVSTPVLIITVRASTVTTDSRSDQADAVLVKPWDMRELRATVERLTASG